MRSSHELLVMVASLFVPTDQVWRQKDLIKILFLKCSEHVSDTSELLSNQIK